MHRSTRSSNDALMRDRIAKLCCLCECSATCNSSSRLMVPGGNSKPLICVGGEELACRAPRVSMAARMAGGPQKCDVVGRVADGSGSRGERWQTANRRYCVEFLLQLAWTMKRSEHAHQTFTTLTCRGKRLWSNANVEGVVGEPVHVVHGLPARLQALRVLPRPEQRRQHRRRSTKPASDCGQGLRMRREVDCSPRCKYDAHAQMHQCVAMARSTSHKA